MIINADGSPKYESKIELLWENPEPTADFDEQTIEIDTDHYAIFYIVMFDGTNNIVACTSMILSEFRDGFQRTHFWYGKRSYWRSVTVTDTGLRFGLGQTASSSTTTTGETSKAIPYRIYGSKF